MTKVLLTRTDLDPAALTRELTARLGQEVALALRWPGQVDEEGEPLEGELVVLDGITGEELDVDGRTVAGAIKAHVAPPTEDAKRTKALDDAEAKAAKGDTKGALADLFALLRADAPAAPAQPGVTPTP